MKLDIQGQTVEVDDGFAKLSPDEQAATVEDIAKQMNIHAEVKQEVQNQAAADASPSWAQEHPTMAAVAAPFAAAANLAAEHPLIAAGGAAGLWKANKISNAYINSAQANAAAQNALANAEMLKAQGLQNRFNVRQGITTPQQGAQAFNQMGQQLTSNPSQAVRPVAPAPAAPAANALQGAQAAQQGENWMARAVNMAKQAAPTLQQYGGRAAQALAPVGRALAPVAELAARYNPAIVGLQAATYSGGLNTNEAEELRRRRMMAPTISR
jgi:hypothetical protein